ncbi:MAG: hypothetical protein NTX53_06900 [candidate division WOR-3 bacterium]|nr:hypothetical protein [candidate division WOR-3 bacterium]
MVKCSSAGAERAELRAELFLFMVAGEEDFAVLVAMTAGSLKRPTPLYQFNNRLRRRRSHCGKRTGAAPR